VITLTGLQKSWERPVLSNLSLHVPEGCLYGLIGPAAAGKSVVLKMIAGLMRPDRGDVQVSGQDVLQMTESELTQHRKGIGMVFQNNALFDFMSVEANIAFPLRRLFDLPETEISRRVAQRGLGLPLDAVDANRRRPRRVAQAEDRTKRAASAVHPHRSRTRV